MNQWQVHLGDVRTVLATLPAQSAQVCVTSPPYFGLRDYGHDGQIGLEATPDAYVAELVVVFREVRRVLRDDGTVFLNLGDSYFGSTQTGGTKGKEGSAKRRGRMFSGASARRDALRSDTAYREPQGSTVPGSAYSGLCGGCAAASSPGSGYSDQPHHIAPSPETQTGRDTAHLDFVEASGAALLLDVPESTTPESYEPPLASCSHCYNCGACLSVLHSSSRDGMLCVRMAGSIDGTNLLASERHSPRTDASGTAWLNYNKLKPKDLIGIPWMVAFALRADGWYLRSDIVWSKPNPMPESVQDRPTKAHEYIFLLSKSQRYQYNAAAIREPYAASTLTQFDRAYEGEATKEYDGTGAQNPSDVKRRIVDKQRGHGRRHAGFNDRWDAMEKTEQTAGGANKRSVWTVATQPFIGAHFATFPETLIEPCILAGSKPGDTVIDPFTGSGTTGAVAVRHQRNFVGVELNPAYLALARERIGSVAPMFAQEVA